MEPTPGDCRTKAAEGALGLPGLRKGGRGHLSRDYATLAVPMAQEQPSQPKPEQSLLYCPRCAQEVSDPLTCGDCLAVICRRCGTPLESPDDLGIG